MQHEIYIHECEECGGKYSTLLANGGAFGACNACLDKRIAQRLEEMEYTPIFTGETETVRTVMHSDGWTEGNG